MKWFKFVACSMLLATLGYAEDTKKPVEWSVGAEYLIPGDDDTWDAAYGGTAKAIFWQQGSFGVALSLGVQQWKSKEIDELYEWASPDLMDRGTKVGQKGRDEREEV